MADTRPMQRMGDTLARTRWASARHLRGSRPNTTPAQQPTEPSATVDEQRAERLRVKMAALLPAHSAHLDDSPSSHRLPGLLCATCGGAGWVRAGEISGDNAWRVELAPCPDASHDRERFDRARRLSDISDPLLRLDFAGYDASDNAEALTAAQAWSTDDGQREQPWLLLYGLMGTGKTHLLAAAFNALVARGRYPLYALTPSLLDHVRDALDSERPQDYGARFRAVQQAPILILDDLGAEKRTAWTDETLFKLLDYRYRQQLPTAVATNLLPDDLEERIASRLQDVHIGRTVLMCGADRRKSNGKVGR